jgi:hypothetical protein
MARIFFSQPALAKALVDVAHFGADRRSWGWEPSACGRRGVSSVFCDTSFDLRSFYKPVLGSLKANGKTGNIFYRTLVDN